MSLIFVHRVSVYLYRCLSIYILQNFFLSLIYMTLVPRVINFCSRYVRRVKVSTAHQIWAWLRHLKRLARIVDRYFGAFTSSSMLNKSTSERWSRIMNEFPRWWGSLASGSSISSSVMETIPGIFRLPSTRRWPSLVKLSVSWLACNFNYPPGNVRTWFDDSISTWDNSRKVMTDPSVGNCEILRLMSHEDHDCNFFSVSLNTILITAGS